MTVYTVSQVNSYIKNMFAQDFVLNRISVQGEVSNCKYHSSGHIYFTLKDQGGTLNAVMFASRRGGLSFTLKDGCQVVVDGSIEVYERSGSYQIYANSIKEAGLGELYERFIKLRDALEEMGMFSDQYKRPIPTFVKTLGVVTAKTGAAIQDIINISTRRNPGIQIVLYPAKVQGQGAAESIVEGIRALDSKVEVIIVGRGGGSLEDLWAFNEEIVARAIFDAKTPIISAVGHETDFTIADYVADLRAPTPSAAAELATFDLESFLVELEDLKDKLTSLMMDSINTNRVLLERRVNSLTLMSPGNRLNEMRMRNEEQRLRLCGAMKNALMEKKHALELKASNLKGLSPLEKIASGYAWVENKNKHVSKAEEIKEGDMLKIRFLDGTVMAKVYEKEIIKGIYGRE